MLNKAIEHTLLKPQAQRHHIENLCQQAHTYGFLGVCINPHWVRVAKDVLAGTQVKVVSVAGFPLGATVPSLKSSEAQRLAQLGVDEIDMVINVGALKDKEFEVVAHEIRGVMKAAEGRPVKAILETSLLTYSEKIEAIQVCRDAGVDFIKTSTGFAGGGATVEDIELIRNVAGPDMRIKASGGIRTAFFANELLQAGAERLGTSSSVAIVSGEPIG